MKISAIIKYLNKSYPFNNDLMHNAKIVSFISVLIFLVLLVFQPFDIKSLMFASKMKFMIGFALVTFVSLSFNLLVLPSFLQKMLLNNDWDIKKEIFWNIWILFSVATGYFLYFQYTDIVQISVYQIGTIFLFSAVPISILIVINQNRLLRMNLQSALALNNKLMQKMNLQKTNFTFESEYQQEVLEIDLNALRLVKSANNYIDIYWVENGMLSHKMLRCSLKKAEERLKEFSFIFKCHRTSIINVKYIDKVEGNSQGVKVHLEDLDFSVPVSRNYINELKQLI
ncbi:MAG: LytTR family transcriptional regulator [Bacteroidales bacterium]|nr:LytTR family transcriptional regulator [Bacteroidales bacterium]